MQRSLRCWLSAISFSLLISCSAPPGDLPRFHEVDPGKVYRSAQPTAAGYAAMAKAGIHTVVKLNTDQVEEERLWAKASGIYLIEIPLPGLFAPEKKDEDMVLSALENPALQPVLVHCEQGEDRTGLAVALYRVFAQHWTPAAAFAEWKALGHSGALFTMDWFFQKETENAHETVGSILLPAPSGNGAAL